ncbi:MAG: acyltransferase [Halieaceae bacterium]|jgi:1-acyl-sn-glycerol-3-phosphate acyltransferase|nr:acyltransferase [Halieaceae bacterium]
MLSSLPPLLRGTIAAVLLFANTIVLAPVLVFVSLLRFVLPIHYLQKLCTVLAIKIAELWISGNSFWMRLTQKMQWDVEGIQALDKNHWYLVTSNHQSWADIVILQHLLNRKIPMLKFFLKQQLIWVPVIGLCWWALDFPFMKRYTREYLEKHPEKRGKDFESTHRACEKFRHTPVTVFNFLEGTRFTPAKHQRQQSPYRNLLKPKAGGIGFVVGAMGDCLNSLLDITIAYPNRTRPSFWEFISGQVDHVIVRVEQKEIPSHFLGRNYFEDPSFQAEFQAWVTALWEEKDSHVDQLQALSITKGWSV